MLMKIYVFLIYLSKVYVLSNHNGDAFFNTGDDCIKMAKNGDCRRNQQLWTTCASDCIKYTKDSKDKCLVNTDKVKERCWSDSVATRTQMQMECPQTCGFAIGWHFKYREFMKMDRFPVMDPALAEEPCSPPRGILEAADIMRNRLLLYMSGGGGIVHGMNYEYIPMVSEKLGIYHRTIIFVVNSFLDFNV